MPIFTGVQFVRHSLPHEDGLAQLYVPHRTLHTPVTALFSWCFGKASDEEGTCLEWVEDVPRVLQRFSLHRKWEHYKGHPINLIRWAKNEADGRMMAVYQHGDTLWVRPLAPVPGVSAWFDMVQWPDGIWRWRFVPRELSWEREQA